MQKKLFIFFLFMTVLTVKSAADKHLDHKECSGNNDVDREEFFVSSDKTLKTIWNPESNTDAYIYIENKAKHAGVASHAHRKLFPGGAIFALITEESYPLLCSNFFDSLDTQKLSSAKSEEQCEELLCDWLKNYGKDIIQKEDAGLKSEDPTERAKAFLGGWNRKKALCNILLFLGNTWNDDAQPACAIFKASPYCPCENIGNASDDKYGVGGLNLEKDYARRVIHPTKCEVFKNENGEKIFGYDGIYNFGLDREALFCEVKSLKELVKNIAICMMKAQLEDCMPFYRRHIFMVLNSTELKKHAIETLPSQKEDEVEKK